MDTHKSASQEKHAPEHKSQFHEQVQFSELTFAPKTNQLPEKIFHDPKVKTVNPLGIFLELADSLINDNNPYKKIILDNLTSPRDSRCTFILHELIAESGITEDLMNATGSMRVDQDLGGYVKDRVDRQTFLESIGATVFLAHVTDHDTLLAQDVLSHIRGENVDYTLLVTRLEGFYRNTLLKGKSDFGKLLVNEYQDKNKVEETYILSGLLYGIMELEPNRLIERWKQNFALMLESSSQVPVQFRDLDEDKIPKRVVRLLENCVREILAAEHRESQAGITETELIRMKDLAFGLKFELSSSASEVRRLEELAAQQKTRLHEVITVAKELKANLGESRKTSGILLQANRELKSENQALREERSRRGASRYTESFEAKYKKPSNESHYEINETIYERPQEESASVNYGDFIVIRAEDLNFLTPQEGKMRDLKLFRENEGVYMKLAEKWANRIKDVEKSGVKILVEKGIGELVFSCNAVPKKWFTAAGCPEGYLKIIVPPGGLEFREKGWGDAYLSLRSEKYSNEVVRIGHNKWHRTPEELTSAVFYYATLNKDNARVDRVV